MRIAIHYKEDYGWVQYDSLSKEVMVNHPNEAVRNTVRDYLNTKRQVDVPASSGADKIGHRKRIEILPVQDKGSLELTMSEMFHATGVHVDWGKEGHSRGSRGKEFGNIYSQEDGDANKTIAKSLLDGDIYDIIN